VKFFVYFVECACGEGPLLDASPVQRSRRWPDFVNRPQTEAELERLRVSVERGRPFGAEP